MLYRLEPYLILLELLGMGGIDEDEEGRQIRMIEENIFLMLVYFSTNSLLQAWTYQLFVASCCPDPIATAVFVSCLHGPHQLIILFSGHSNRTFIAGIGIAADEWDKKCENEGMIKGTRIKDQQ